MVSPWPARAAPRTARLGRARARRARSTSRRQVSRAATCCPATRSPRGRTGRPPHRGGGGHHHRRAAGLAPARRGRAASSCWRPRPCVTRPRHLRGRQERALRRRRGDEGRARQDRLLAAPQGGRRLFLRALRRQRRDGGAGAGPAHPPRLDAPRREGGHPGLAPTSSPATSSSTTIRTSAGATCPTSTSSPRPSTRAPCSASRACARTGRTSAAPRPAATAPPPRSSARACGCPRCGSARRVSPIPTWRASSSANVRTPDERRGDLRAQMAANQRGVLRLQELAREARRRAPPGHHAGGHGLLRAPDARACSRGCPTAPRPSRTSATATASSRRATRKIGRFASACA